MGDAIEVILRTSGRAYIQLHTDGLSEGGRRERAETADQG
ncbi:Uncharacterised protein [Mycobacteroides abscessus subsp. abscessus]|nr:Uncharacterised protein [Mycobacteroides abscessus subsp. abscessus]SHP68725.1 Uncharacterised protein [Mycobacteroides abscessus subsp. abscessus]SHY39269.1 Uncharacterised protein [Mycobacteroides abscessus subsp. abscessus]SKD93754.1 Uncharacterised protein [Mycobacteroides abscessus subsp. abscessus]